MEDNRRRNERYDVYLYVEQVERDLPQVRIMNLSASGFLVRGAIAAGVGGVLHASFRVKPLAGEMRVRARGRVVHSRRVGFESEYGIDIEGFGSEVEESAYRRYVEELADKRGSDTPPA